MMSFAHWCKLQRIHSLTKFLL